MSPLVAARAAAAARGYGWGLPAGGPSGGFESIATVTAAGGETSLSFTNIPQTYVALQIRSVQVGIIDGTALRLNGVSSYVYAHHFLRGNGASTQAYGAASQNQIDYMLGTSGITLPSQMCSVAIVDIHNYASTTQNTTIRGFNGADFNDANGRVSLSSALFQDTSSVSSISFLANGTFGAGTTFALYGIRGAA